MELLKQLIKNFYPFAKKRLKFNKPVELFFKPDFRNAQDPLGKTAFYDPDNLSITLYTANRHPKDILRSFSHELVHHAQNCRGEFSDELMGEVGEGYAQNNDHLREMEREAYEEGNLCFRDWEDSVKSDKIILKVMTEVCQNAKKELIREQGEKQMTSKKNDIDLIKEAIQEVLAEQEVRQRPLTVPSTADIGDGWGVNAPGPFPRQMDFPGGEARLYLEPEQKITGNPNKNTLKSGQGWYHLARNLGWGGKNWRTLKALITSDPNYGGTLVAGKDYSQFSPESVGKVSRRGAEEVLANLPRDAVSREGYAEGYWGLRDAVQPEVEYVNMPEDPLVAPPARVFSDDEALKYAKEMGFSADKITPTIMPLLKQKMADVRGETTDLSYDRPAEYTEFSPMVFSPSSEGGAKTRAGAGLYADDMPLATAGEAAWQLARGAGEAIPAQGYAGGSGGLTSDKEIPFQRLDLEDIPPMTTRPVRTSSRKTEKETPLPLVGTSRVAPFQENLTKDTIKQLIEKAIKHTLGEDVDMVDDSVKSQVASGESVEPKEADPDVDAQMVEGDGDKRPTLSPEVEDAIEGGPSKEDQPDPATLGSGPMGKYKVEKPKEKEKKKKDEGKIKEGEKDMESLEEKTKTDSPDRAPAGHPEDRLKPLEEEESTESRAAREKEWDETIGARGKQTQEYFRSGDIRKGAGDELGMSLPPDAPLQTSAETGKPKVTEADLFEETEDETLEEWKNRTMYEGMLKRFKIKK